MERRAAPATGHGRCKHKRSVLRTSTSVFPEMSVLRDGRVVRAAAPEDGERLRRMFSRLSPTSIYRRFHSPLPRVPERAIAQAIEANNHDTVSLVALVDEEIVGQAIYVRLANGDEAEAAAVVEEDWQRRGIGSLLLYRLAEEARCRGIVTLTGAVLPENGAMRALLAGAGTLRYSKEDGVFLAHAPLSVSSPIRRVSGDVGRQTPGPENTSSAAYRTKSGPEPAQWREMVKARQLR